uniref:Uncharacterized protein n=1 Tax=Panagrolaimus sp. ES5 TaxID=591445 RepID=A0AC34GXI1_9BILA
MNKKIYFDPSSALKQSFIFPTDVIKYVIKGSNGKLWLKLIQSCKYFYAKQKSIFVKNTTVKECGLIEVFDKPSFVYWETAEEIPSNMFLAGKLTIYGPIEMLKSKIYKCSLKELKISSTKLTINEFEFLTASESLESFSIQNSNILYSNKSVVQLEDIFAALPNITSFTYRHTYLTNDYAINKQTFYQMAYTCRNRKLLIIDIQGIGYETSPSDVVLFIQNYAANHCKIFLNLKPTFPQTMIFKSMINQMRLKWEPAFAMPVIQLRSSNRRF